jgi:hypothetical protein
MPALRREPDVFPDDLFTFPSDSFPWMVAHVRSRQEKALARYLRERAVPFYLPQMEQKKQRSGRTFTFVSPSVWRLRLRPWPCGCARGVVAQQRRRNLIAVVDQEQLGQQLQELKSLHLAGTSLRPHVEIRRRRSGRDPRGCIPRLPRDRRPREGARSASHLGPAVEYSDSANICLDRLSVMMRGRSSG